MGIPGRFIEVEGTLNGHIIRVGVGEVVEVAEVEGHGVVAGEQRTLEAVEVCRMIRFRKGASGFQPRFNCFAHFGCSDIHFTSSHQFGPI